MDDLLGSADCVLFDFDGPLCRLFAGHPAGGIADRIRRDVIGPRQSYGLLTEEMRATGDPLVLLRGLAPGSELARLVERTLTEEELHATATAMPTPYADRLVHTLVATGRRVAVTTNNAQEVAETYLAGRRLGHYFTGTVHGRLHDVSLLKPHPDCLERALAATGSTAGRAVMIGDTVPDHQAATAAGVPFVGYAPRAERREALHAAGARHIVGSLKEVLDVVGAPSFG
jgi:phosphoglycolate phosphatase-like HAD superfamily hydrolase